MVQRTETDGANLKKRKELTKTNGMYVILEKLDKQILLPYNIWHTSC